jgi:hypothetical protein
MNIKCFKILESDFKYVSLTTLKLVKELKVDVEYDLVEVGIEDLIKKLDLSGCDCIYLSSCDSNLYSESFEYLSKLKGFQYLISPRPSKLLGLAMLVKADESKEIDAFFGSQLGVKYLDVDVGEVYVFEGNVTLKIPDNCLGILVKTDSGIRFILLDDVVSSKNVRSSKKVRKRKRSRKSKRKSKKKRE